MRADTVGSACFAGLDGAEPIAAWRLAPLFWRRLPGIEEVRQPLFWRIPVVDGEFLCEAMTGLTQKGGWRRQFPDHGTAAAKTVRAAERAVVAMSGVQGVILPFPGGVARSGSKVGSKYKGMLASTNDAYCPTLGGAGRPSCREVGSVLEFVIDGLTARPSPPRCAPVSRRRAAGPEHGAFRVTAGNYGGKLGPFHFHLKDSLL